MLTPPAIKDVMPYVLAALGVSFIITAHRIMPAIGTRTDNAISPPLVVSSGGVMFWGGAVVLAPQVGQTTDHASISLPHLVQNLAICFSSVWG